METASYAIALTVTAIFLFCFLFVSKLMAIEMILIYQVGYGGLLVLEKLEVYMRAMRKLWVVNGFNEVLGDRARSLPGRLT